MIIAGARENVSLPSQEILNTVGSQSAWGALPGVVKSFPPSTSRHDGGGLAGETTGKRDPFMAVSRWKYKFAEDLPSILFTDEE